MGSTADAVLARFADLDPVPQDDGPDPVAAIAYSGEYTRLMDMFRACLRLNEKSERVLDLTEQVISHNPANYTVWKVRQDVLFALGADLRRELEYVTDMAKENPKNYQIWHHRQIVVTAIGDPAGELDFVNLMLDMDAKNSHAWSYRQFLIRRFGLWDGELAEVDRFLRADVRNNSAWNQRFFVLRYRPAPQPPRPTELAAEIDYALDALRIASRNESPWAYLRGLAKYHSVDLAAHPRLAAALAEWTSSDPADAFRPFAAQTMLDVIAERRRLRRATGAGGTEAAAGEVDDAKEEDRLLALLVERDPVRRAYWTWRRAAAASADVPA